MGIQTLTIKTCDRCGAQMHDHLSREHPENGELRVAWDGHMGGMAWNGDCGGASFNGKALLCHRCEREFLEWIKPRADGVTGEVPVVNRTHSAAYYFYMARRVRGAYATDCERQSWYQLFVDAAGVKGLGDADQ